MSSLNDLVNPGTSGPGYDPAKAALMDGYSTEDVANLVDPPSFNEGLALLASGFISVFFLLLESGDMLLLESGDRLVLG
jgi:hypothetical protein